MLKNIQDLLANLANPRRFTATEAVELTRYAQETEHAVEPTVAAYKALAAADTAETQIFVAAADYATHAVKNQTTKLESTVETVSAVAEVSEKSAALQAKLQDSLARIDKAQPEFFERYRPILDGTPKQQIGQSSQRFLPGR